MLQPSHRYCKGSPTGLLNSWDNCRELCTSCYRSHCLSSTRMGQHSSVACQPEALLEFLRFQRPPYSIYVAFPCPSQGSISFPQCGSEMLEALQGNLCMLKPVIHKSSKGTAAACVGALWGCLAFLQPKMWCWVESLRFLQASVMASKMNASEVLCVVTWLSGTSPGLCCQLELG